MKKVQKNDFINGLMLRFQKLFFKCVQHFYLSYKQFLYQKLMQILRCAKNSHPVSSSLAFGLYFILEVQIWSFFIVKESPTIYGKVFNFIYRNMNFQPAVVLIFISYLLQACYLIFLRFWISARSKEKKSTYQSNVLRFQQIRPFLTIVPYSTINFSAFQSDSMLLIILASLNIFLMVVQIIPIKIINISYRFIEKNYIRRKDYNIINWWLILPIVYTISYYDTLYGAVLIIFRALLMMYGNFNNLENEQIRKSLWLFPLISLQLAFLVIVNQYLEVHFFSNIVVFTFILLMTFYSSVTLSSHLSYTVLKYHINHSKQIFNSDNQDQMEKSTQVVQMTEDELADTLLQLRIMVKIYHNRINYQTLEENKQHVSENYDNWWMIFNRFVLDHKVNCNNVNCKCALLQPRSQDNWKYQNQIVTTKISELIFKLKAQSISSNKIKIIQNYFLIEMEKKPMKTYYQIIKLSNSTLNRQETLEVQNLILETRDNFQQLFLKQKVRNVNLDIEPLFQFQNHLKNMRLKLNDMAVEYRHFYEIFANNFVQMQSLKQKTRLLTEFKKQFNKEIDFCLKKFNKSLQLMTFCIVYFRFFDEYTTKLEKIEQKAQFLRETFKITVRPMKRGSVDIFDPLYGAVKIDLVFKTGQIVSITKTMCSLLGFTHRQLADEKINKIMPLMFSRYHDRFINNFVQKGRMKILKEKQKVFYARNSKKLIVPITIRLKIDYSSSQGMYAVAFTKLSETKSEFILMNNYGKVEEITAGIYDKFFKKALGQEPRKVKRLCVGKLLLSFNCILKSITEADDRVTQGLFLSSNSQKTLIDYYKFPQFGKIYKGKSSSQYGQSTSRSGKSLTSMSSMQHSSDGSRTIDLSEDIAKYSVDIKQSLRIYFKNLDFREVFAFRVSYRCHDYITSEFKCKILQIVSIREQLLGMSLFELLKQQIHEVSEYLGFDDRELSQFKIFRQQIKFISKTLISESKLDIEELQQKQSEHDVFAEQRNRVMEAINAAEGNSVASSLQEMKERSKKKEIVVNSFQQQPRVNSRLQIALTVLIFILAFILIVVCVFSVQLQSDYQKIQQDNLVLTNYRIDYLLLLGIQELTQMYNLYNIPAPKFIQQKKSLYVEAMKTQMQLSTTWVSLSKDGYQVMVPFVQSDINYKQQKSLLATLVQMYAIFAAQPKLGHYITDNYITMSSSLLGLTSNQQVIISNASSSYLTQIHIVIIFYSSILVMVIIGGIWFRRIALAKEDKVIDFLPFLKPEYAKKNQYFFEKFHQINKEADQIDIQSIQQIAENSDAQLYQRKNTKETKKSSKKSAKKQIQNESSSRLIRVVKNENNGITFKIVFTCFLVFGLCLFVIFYTEFFFASANSKFNTYLRLAESAYLVQLIPSRITLLYFSNINRMLRNESLYNFSGSFYNITHDRIFELPKNLSSSNFSGTDMEKVISEHFYSEICSLIECSGDPNQMGQLNHQQVYYLAYRFVDAFNYMRKIITMLPNMTNPQQVAKQWMEQNNVLSLLQTTDFVLDLLNRSEATINGLFTDQINQIGTILLAISLTLIPTLILVLLLFRKNYIHYVVQRLQSTEHVYSHLSWQMLLQNNYAIHYFQNKVKNFNTK